MINFLRSPIKKIIVKNFLRISKNKIRAKIFLRTSIKMISIKNFPRSSLKTPPALMGERQWSNNDICSSSHQVADKAVPRTACLQDCDYLNRTVFESVLTDPQFSLLLTVDLVLCAPLAIRAEAKCKGEVEGSRQVKPDVLHHPPPGKLIVL